MNTEQLERLDKIKAQCQHLVELFDSTSGRVLPGAHLAAAGWRATIVAIEGLIRITNGTQCSAAIDDADAALREILGAWKGVDLD